MYQLDGAGVNSIDDLYVELDRLLMTDENWQLGASLDALNDALFRVEGEAEPARFVWTDHADSREALGQDATERWLRGKLERPEVFNQSLIRRQLDDLHSGQGKTYFELVLEVFAGHPRIELELR
jgi:RNAse (barnase) inhibitor barstar